MDYRTADTVDLMVCIDCTMMMANGEFGDDEAREIEVAETLATNWPNNGITLGRAEGHHENDIDFSNAPCDGCGSLLAGSRHAATGWIAGN